MNWAPRMALALAIGWLVACKHENQPPPQAEIVAPSPWAAPVDSPLFAHDYRHTFTRLTNVEKSGLHWGQFVRIYVNQNPEIYTSNFREYLRHYVNGDPDGDSSTHFKTYAPGTIFLKEHYSDSGGKPNQPMMLIGMIKHSPGYDREGGDWEYLAWTTQGLWVVKGNRHDPAVKTMCSSCHANMAERDFIFSTYSRSN